MKTGLSWQWEGMLLQAHVLTTSVMKIVIQCDNADAKCYLHAMYCKNMGPTAFSLCMQYTPGPELTMWRKKDTTE